MEDELRMEILRISKRNLGRDNRIVSFYFNLVNLGILYLFECLDPYLIFKEVAKQNKFYPRRRIRA